MRGAPDVSWDSVDWSRQDKTIANSLGVSPATVGRRRKSLGKPRKFRGRSLEIDWERLDWSRTDRQIAQDLGVYPGTVAKHRKRVDALPPPNRVATSSVDWDAVDWSKSDMRIASELRVSACTVGTQRKRTGAPRSGGRDCDLRAASIDWSSVDWSRSDSRIAREMGVSSSLAGRKRKLFGAPRSAANGGLASRFELPGGAVVTARELGGVFGVHARTAIRRLKRGWLGAVQV